MKNLYEMIFKRRSIRKYDSNLKLTNSELDDIKTYLKNLKPLINDIEVQYKILKKEEVTGSFGEYCLVVYSEKKENYLLNVGYLLEQFDLYLTSKNIGTCYYGLGKTDEVKYNGLEFVIMFSFGKSREEDFRRDLENINRKKSSEIWEGDLLKEIKEVVRYAPSACNSQPWKVIEENNILHIYRMKEDNKMSIIEPKLLDYLNEIDMGIFLCFLDVSLKYHDYKYEKQIVEQTKDDMLIEVAKYKIM